MTPATGRRVFLTVLAELQEAVSFAVANLLNPEVGSDITFSLGDPKPYPAFPLGSGDQSYPMAGAGGSIGMADPD